MPEPHRSTHMRAPPKHLDEFHCYYALASLYEPNSFKEACSHPEWQQAMSEELQALEKNDTWDSVDLPMGKSLLGYKMDS